MAKCCCAPEINSAKLQVLNAIASNGRVVPAFVPQRPTVFPAAEEIARRVADLLNKPAPPNSDGIQQQLDAIVSALITLKAREPDTKLLNQILRNQNDAFELQKQYQREINIRIDALATRDQSKDLLQAIRLLRLDMLEQFRTLARALSVGFAAVGAAIVALGVAQRVAFLAEITAKLAQTATILRAIAGINLKPTQDPRIAEVLKKLKDIQDGQLSLEPVTTKIPICNPDPASATAIIPKDVKSFAIKNKKGDSTSALLESLTMMAYDLLAVGQLKCGTSTNLESEVVADINKDDPNSDTPRTFYCRDIEPKFFIISITEVDPKFIRTYKLAGSQSEYGAGNWAVVDSVGRVDGDFVRLFNQSQRLHPRTELSGAGVRLSLKRGISAIVTAYGTSNQ